MITWILIYGSIMLINVFTLLLGNKRNLEHLPVLFLWRLCAWNILFSRSQFYTASIHLDVPTYLLLPLLFVPSCTSVLHLRTFLSALSTPFRILFSGEQTLLFVYLSENVFVYLCVEFEVDTFSFRVLKIFHCFLVFIISA